MKIIVLDDDPTGSQSVHGCPLLLRWDPATLKRALLDPSPLLFLLSDTRALEPEQAVERVTSICRSLRAVLGEPSGESGPGSWLLVSRGDSTLRGHFPLEIDRIEAELGPFDATLLVPAFLEGGRTTVDGVHLLHGEPVHRSAFAADARFGYPTSDLPAWVEHKSGGERLAESVQQISLAELEPQGEQALVERLLALSGNPLVVVNAQRPEQLEVLARAVRAVLPARRLLVQSAASLLQALAALPPQPLPPASLARLRRGAAPGAVLVGSHVPLSNQQLQLLLVEPACAGVELPVERVLKTIRRLGPESADLADQALEPLREELLERLGSAWLSGRTPVLFSSRGERSCRNAGERQRLSLTLAGLMARLAAGLPPELSYLISKGGTTSQTLLRDGLALAAVRLEGQLLPGLSLLRLPADHDLFPQLPLLTMPGNLGVAETLRQAWWLMESAGRDGSGG
ncbi:four-carbon acid sugar kinase family protein [Synechococcus sp. 1G10]|uniref:four-carbon acid sugar kinase family protein n=1 Tax=Synechococcus sp. 1G10 TaxID=2025605 RepID=UPI001E40D9A5|nr:four-carbon acid sugar kinase family protein [Synechococcus sp. 1G10]